MDLGDIDVFGISAGPGSFTGLRVGLSTIKGLVYATGKKFVAVPTLEAFAWNIPFSNFQICPLLDARRKEVYAAVFKWSKDRFFNVIDERAIKIGDLLPVIDALRYFWVRALFSTGRRLSVSLVKRHSSGSSAHGAFAC